MTADSQPHHRSRWVIATDLDGTLLDRAYDLPQAATAVNKLRARFGCVTQLVFATSKTLGELLPFAALCDQAPVLIFENGNGFAVPELGGYQKNIVGKDYGSIRALLQSLRASKGFEFQGFGDMSVDELCALTGLSPESAVLAQARAASEPLLWRDTDERLADLTAMLAREDLSLIRGGQFYHVASSNTDKASALTEWQTRHAQNTRLLACGDAPNDLQMLQMADKAIVFPGKAGEWLLPLSADVEHALEAGPDEWLTAINRVLGNPLSTNAQDIKDAGS